MAGSGQPIGGADRAGRGSSPYSTGGGGVTFAQLVASVYLASMLTRGRRREVSDLHVRTVGFQNGPKHPVDDLLITCGDSTSEVTLAVACRATPNFVNSDDETVKLVKSLLAEVEKFDSDAHQVAVATAGWTAQWEDLAKLCDIARAHANPALFKKSMDVDRRWTKQVQGRLDQFQKMVSTALKGAAAADEVLRLTWRLLGRLHVLGFAVQSPDESDRTALATALDGVADPSANGVALRDRLESLVATYDNTGGVVDLNLVRRDLHGLLDAAATRTRHAWQVLAEHREVSAAAVRATIGDGTVVGPVHVTFTDCRNRLANSLLDAGLRGTALLISGESGIGKSALTLSAVKELEAGDGVGFEAVVLNFRSMPQSSLDLQGLLGMSLRDVLSELSAASRLLVIDAADAAIERSVGLLRDLVLAAKAAGVGVVAVSSDAASDFVKEQLATAFDDVDPFKMDPLDDEDVAVVADAFPLLRPILQNLPAKSLLRRPVVLDLLTRTGVAPAGRLGEWECLDLIWSKVVRSDARPNAGSAEAREQTLLMLAAAAMQLPPGARPADSVDAAAVDALRKDHLLAPANPYRAEPEFAHDEVRRYATAILLVRAKSQTELLEASPVPRLAMSAATLACKGALKAPGVDLKATFLDLLVQYKTFAAVHGARWADVPVEAVLETPAAYVCLKTALGDNATGLVLADVVRVVQQRHKFDGLITPGVAGEVVRILLDADEPWDVSKESFELLADWLTTLMLSDAPAKNPLRIALRERLLTYWKSFPPPASKTVSAGGAATGLPARPQRRRDLDYHQTKEEFVETMALLGADIDDDVETCLRAIAEDAPVALAPAADSPASARAIAQRDPELLAELMEAYYIDDNQGWHRDEGVRRHQGRWTGNGAPFVMYYFGGFWQLFNRASLTTQARVLNNILNSGANARDRTIARLNTRGLFPTPVDENGNFTDDAGTGAGEESNRGAVLNLDGTPRLYAGDSHVWSWYRGTSVGPYSAMSALQAMERAADTWITLGVSPRLVIETLLKGCDNLAVPGMLFGLLVRHLEKVDDELDAFLVEPLVWELEFGRKTSEYSGLAARTEGLANLDRRQWTPREVAAMLLARGGPERAARLKKVGAKLIENGDRIGISQELTKNWAASLDAERYKVTAVAEGLRIEVEPPAELVAAQKVHAAHQTLVETSLRLQNRYWGSAKNDGTYVAPSSEEILADLVAGRKLLDTDADVLPSQPEDAVAHVIRAAVERAVAGDLTALGDEAGFATEFVLTVAFSFRDAADQREEGFFFDLGADRAVAQILPAYLTEQLAEPLKSVGGNLASVADAGLGMAGKAPLETRLFLARGCDVVWSVPCAGEPCVHRIVLDWLLETARGAEIGPWDERGHGRERVRIDGDVAERLNALPGDSVDITVLDAAIRGLGAAASTNHCCTEVAAAMLATFLDVEAKAMVVHEEKGWTADDRGSHTLVAARALLQGFANNGNVEPVLGHLDVLRADSGLLSNFLHGLAAAGAENEVLSSAARGLWPSVVRHALGYRNDEDSPYKDRSWGSWSANALLPAPLTWSQSIYNECIGAPLDWVRADDLLDFIDDWLPVARGDRMCVDGLIGLLRRLPVEVQVRRGLAWVSDVCIQDGTVTVVESWNTNDWLKEVRSSAEKLKLLDKWQMLVDSLVVAGNEGLAPHSR